MIFAQSSKISSKFKSFAGGSDLGRRGPAASGSVNYHNSSVPHLRPFAQMIFDSFDVAYRCKSADVLWLLLITKDVSP